MDTVTISREEYEDLLDMRTYLLARQTSPLLLDHDEAMAFLDEPYPLAFWRKRRGLTQADLARELAVSQPFIAQIETGKRLGDVHFYQRAARFFGVQIESLIPAASEPEDHADETSGA